MLRSIVAASLVIGAALVLAASSWAQGKAALPTGFDGVQFDISLETLKKLRPVGQGHMDDQERGFEFYMDQKPKPFLGDEIRGNFSMYDGVLKEIQFVTPTRPTSVEDCINALDRWAQYFAQRHGPFNPPVLTWSGDRTSLRLEAEKRYPDRRVVVFVYHQIDGGCSKGVRYISAFVFNGRYRFY